VSVVERPPYVAAIYTTTIALAAGIARADQDNHVPQILGICVILCLPVSVWGVVGIYVIGGFANNVVQTPWAVTAIYTTMFGVMAAANATLIGTIVERRRERRERAAAAT
jgi:hypothetical protein